MKKIIFSLIGIVAIAIGIYLIFRGGQDDPQPQPVPVVEHVFNDMIKADYEAFVAEHGSDNALFYEVQAVLNGDLNEIEPDSAKVIFMTEVFQSHDTCFMYHKDLVEGTVDEEVVVDYWMGDFDMHPGRFTVMFEDAVKALVNDTTGVGVPAGNKMTLRRPCSGAEFPHSLYIFGQHNSYFVSVDSETGEVFPINYGASMENGETVEGQMKGAEAAE